MSQLITSRRSFLVGLGALITAPAIVRASVIMPIKQMLILPEPAIITDLTFPIEGFARIAGWQGEWASVWIDENDQVMHVPKFNNRLRPSNEKLADFDKVWNFTEHAHNGDYRPSRTVVTLRNGEQWQRGKGKIII